MIGEIKPAKDVGRAGPSKYILRKCPCGEERWVALSGTKREGYTGLCKKCSTKNRFGENNNAWRGGKYVMNGYVFVRAVGHPLSRSNGYALEHRLIASQNWGIGAVIGKVVHHKNGNKSDNRIENLEIMSHEEHTSLHCRKPGSKLRGIGEKNFTVTCKCGCGNEFLKYDKYRQPRMYVHGHNRRLIPSNAKC